MKLQIDKKPFADAVGRVARSIPARPAAPILAGLLLQADEQLHVSGFDYETSTRATVASTVLDPGRVLLSGRLLAEIAKALPNKPIDITVDGTQATLLCGQSKFTLPTLPIDDYPSLPDLPAPIGQIDPKIFADAVTQVGAAAGKDDTLPMLTGIHMEIGDTITLAATDRFHLAVREIPWETTGFKSTILVPSRVLVDAARDLGEHPVSVAVTDSMLGLSTDRWAVTTRLLDAEFPRYQKLIPSGHDSKAVINIGELSEAVKRVMVVARAALVQLDFTEDGLALTAGSEDESSAEEHVDCSLEGPPITIGFNPAYLLDALGSTSTERAVLLFTTGRKPALIKPDNSGDHLNLVMPVRLPGVE